MSLVTSRARFLAVLSALFVSVAAQLGQDVSWSLSEGEIPSPRHEHCAVTFGGKIYLIGGRGLKPVDEFDTETRQWSSKNQPSFGLEIHHMQCVVFGDRIVVGAAWTGSFPAEDNFSDVYFYEPVQDTWTKETTMPPERSRGSAGAAVYNDKIYFVNGNVGGHREEATALNLLDSYEPSTGQWTELANSPTPRDHMGAGVIDGKMYVMGGRDSGVAAWDAVAAATLTIDCYSFGDDSWTTLTEQLDMPLPGSTLTVMMNYLVLAGGEISDGQGGRPALATTRVFDTSSSSFLPDVPDMSVGRNGVALCTCGTAVYAPTGSSSRAETEYNSMEVLDLGLGISGCSGDQGEETLPPAATLPPEPTSSSVSSTENPTISSDSPSASSESPSSSSESPNPSIEPNGPLSSTAPEDPVCFPAGGIVEVRHRGRIPLEELRVGDAVQSDGLGEFSTVFGFSHRETESNYRFLSVTLERNETITLTHKHLMLTNENVMIPARHVRPGDYLADGLVLEVKPSIRRGLINPHTESGRIVVDGVQATCYTESVDWRLASVLLSGPKLLWRVTGADWLAPLHRNDSPIRLLLRAVFNFKNSG